MMSLVDWSSLRPWRGSQQNAFEELCAQLIEPEAPAGSAFIRKGQPDGGVECYWKDSHGNESCWQAKFFRETLGPSQWTQMTDSFVTALDKHPRMTEYAFCIPRDLADPRTKGQKFETDRWNEHVKKWTALAKKKHRRITIHRWGNYAITKRLTEPHHRGRLLFWFDKDHLTDEWFTQQVASAISNLRAAHQPALAVTTETDAFFDCIGRSQSYYEGLKRTLGKTNRTLTRSAQAIKRAASAECHRKIEEYLSTMTTTFRVLHDNDDGMVSIAALEQMAHALRNLLGSILDEIHGLPQQLTEREKSECYQDVREATGALYDLTSFLSGSGSTLVNHPYMILTGDAGAGKTFLVAEQARQRTIRGEPTVLLLGEHFRHGPIWDQVLAQLGLHHRASNDVLATLNAAGAARRRRVLLIIDAINESTPPDIWQTQLNGLVNDLTHFEWIGLIVTVRHDYRQTCLPARAIGFQQITHSGFAGKTIEAMRRYFDHYEILAPAVPLLDPEFDNPLFLYLFCEALHRSGLRRIPASFTSLKTILEQFLDATNKKLARELDYDPAAPLVTNAVMTIADAFVNARSTALPRATAVATINALLPNRDHSRSLFKALLSEGIITEGIEWSTNSAYTSVVRFLYQRLFDYYTTAALIKTHTAAHGSTAPLPAGTTIPAFLQSQGTMSWAGGVWGQLAIQLPDTMGCELFEALPQYRDDEHVIIATLDSIIWRRHDNRSPALIRFVTGILDPASPFTHDALQRLLLVAPLPDHPLNADYLHQRLAPMPVAERDAWWTTFLCYDHDEPTNATKRLVTWARDTTSGSLSNEAVRLSCTVLAWMLTASHRALRDNATKAITNLLKHRLVTIEALLDRFMSCNDPYVTERVLCAVYGSVMRSHDANATTIVARKTFAAVFSDPEQHVHLLSRDYARGIIERARALDASLDIPTHAYTPPYSANWPTDIPTAEELERQYAKTQILYSVMHWDFGRYIIGTNSWSCDWTDIPINQPQPVPAKHALQRFLDTLPAPTQELLNEISRLALLQNLPENDELRSIHEDLVTKARTTLGTDRFAKWEALHNAPRHHRPTFDLKLLQRFVVDRAFRCGWTVQRFGRFEESLGYRRDGPRVERIGKKYQWIAYHEGLARIADNYQYSGRTEHITSYQGPWHGFHRDIDPSVLIQNTPSRNATTTPSAWWVPPRTEAWRDTATDGQWLQRTSDLPDLRQHLLVKDPLGTVWVLLHTHLSWEEPTPTGYDWSDTEHRQIWIEPQAYFVAEEHFASVWRWAKQQQFFGRWMPEHNGGNHSYLGELGWAPAYREYADATADIGTPDKYERKNRPHPMWPASDEYHGGDARDSSTNSSVTLQRPSPWMVDHMGLEWRGVEGEYCWRGTVVAIDPSAKQVGPPALLIKADFLTQWLRHKNYRLVWTVMGEKRILTAGGGETGRLELNGACTLQRTDKRVGVIARVRTTYQAFERQATHQRTMEHNVRTIVASHRRNATAKPITKRRRESRKDATDR